LQYSGHYLRGGKRTKKYLSTIVVPDGIRTGVSKNRGMIQTIARFVFSKCAKHVVLLYRVVVRLVVGEGGESLGRDPPVTCFPFLISMRSENARLIEISLPFKQMATYF
jgi:hypothetical protein